MDSKELFRNKYRSEKTAQIKSNNIHYMIDPTYKNINRLFIILCTNGDNDPTTSSSDKYYMPLVEITNFKALKRIQDTTSI